MTKFIIIITTTLICICFLCIFILKRKCRKLSCTDELTGLWNPEYFKKKVALTLKNNQKDIFAIVDIDIRNFRYINMMYGTDEGSLLLIKIGKRLLRCTAPYGGYVTRGYADHFLVFRKLAQNETTESFVAAIEGESAVYNSRASAGTGLREGIVFTGPGYGYDTALNLFGKAAYAKRNGKCKRTVSCTVFDHKIEEQMQFEQKIEFSINGALKNGELYVVYQPQVNLQTEKITGAEALLRWNRPDRKIINPDEFLPVLEKSGEICRIDFFVYETVFKFIRQQLDLGQQIVPVSINMSRRHLDMKGFAQRLLSLALQYSVPPEYICVEILEQSSGYNKELLKVVTCELQAEGFSVAIDDFGSGESSFDMLASVPVNILKLDKKFLKNLETSSCARVILKKIVELAGELEKTIICEGAETRQQVDFLKKISCEEVQGFYYSHPLLETDFVSYMNEHR
jgi:EAL domain-containing protein (putative c-di-GMP-specific phosphodiesterase class I)/GGDEF domain-containing protein